MLCSAYYCSVQIVGRDPLNPMSETVRGIINRRGDACKTMGTTSPVKCTKELVQRGLLILAMLPACL